MTKMINDWAPETKDLLNALIAANFVIRGGDNGEERFKWESHEAIDKFIENLIACDESRLYVTDPNGKKVWLYLVLGNEPGEIVCDYSMPAEGKDCIDAVTDAHYEKWCNREQPTKPSPYA